MKTIREVQKAFAAADGDALVKLIEEYQSDQRSGIKKLVERGRRKLEEKAAEESRLDIMLSYERSYDQARYICGVDEAGRGPLAGPVVAAAVILPKDVTIAYLNDSKQLSARRRELLYDEIMEKAVSVGVGMASPARIDEINILQATYEAMREAIDKLSVRPDVLLNDAVIIPGIDDIPQEKIIKGDAKSLSIAAASVIAKVTRDRMMMAYHQLYPEYGFDKHKGYGTAEHITALQNVGPSPIHRRSFIKNFT